MYNGLAYLATPYSHKDPSVMEYRYERANHYAARLIEAGWPVFSPISHSHSIAAHMPSEENNWATWITQDYAILAKCSRLFLLMAEGWDISQGVAGELQFAKRNGIDIVFLSASHDGLVEVYPDPKQVGDSWSTNNDGIHANFICPYCDTVFESSTRKTAKSCGCLRRRKSSDRATLRNLTHNRTGTPEYNSWQSMLQRCYNKNHEAFNLYGNAGIVVCDAWLGFENFLADMGQRPTLGHSLERLDGCGNYCPGNCVWATKLEQTQNRRNTIRLTVDGVTKTLQEWADETGIPYSTLHGRKSRGWTAEEIVRGRVSA